MVKLLISLCVVVLSLSCKARVDRSNLLERGEQGIDTTNLQIVLQDSLDWRDVNFNPYLTNSESVMSVARFVYEPLAYYTSENPLTEDPKPLLAEKIEYADDGLSLLITLRKGIKFHSLNKKASSGFRLQGEEKSFSLERGSPGGIRSMEGQEYELTAEDVEFSLLVAAHIKSPKVNNWLNGSNIRVQKFPDNKYKLKVIWNPDVDKGISKNRNYVLAYKILSTLIIPKKSFNYEYNFDWSSPTAKHFREPFTKSGLSKAMWGTGPYIFKGAGPTYSGESGYNTSITSKMLVKNPNYWGNNFGASLNPAGRLPFENIQMTEFAPPKQNRFLDEKKLVVTHFDAYEHANYEKSLAKDGGRVIPLKSKFTYFLLFNFADNRIGTTNFMRRMAYRQAFAHFNNAKVYIESKTFGDSMTPARSFFGSTIFADPMLLPSFNPKEAVKKLQFAGRLKADGSVLHHDDDYRFQNRYLTLDYAKGDAAGYHLAYKLRASVREHSKFRIEVNNDNRLSHSDVFQGLAEREAKVAKIRTHGFIDPKTMWHSAGSGNHMSYRDQQVDQLIDQIHSEMDATRIIPLYRSLDQMLKRKLPAIPLVQAKDSAALSSLMAVYARENNMVLKDLLETLNW